MQTITEIPLFIGGALWDVQIIVMLDLCGKDGLVFILLQCRVIFFPSPPVHSF